MFIRDIDVVRVIHADRVAQRLNEVQVDRSIAHGPRASIRRIVGRSIVRVGRWVAAEPEPQPQLRARTGGIS
jgi:hypothetical protein